MKIWKSHQVAPINYKSKSNTSLIKIKVLFTASTSGNSEGATLNELRSVPKLNNANSGFSALR